MSKGCRSTSLPEALANAINPIPIPSNPKDFLGKFLYGPIDDESGQITAAAQHNDQIGRVLLTTKVNESKGAIIIEGKFNPDTHKAFKIPIEQNQNGGMTFVLKSYNMHRDAFNHDLCKRSFNKRQLETMISEEAIAVDKPFTFAAHSSNVPFGSCTSKVTLTFTEDRSRLYIDTVHIELDFKAYEAWIWRITH